MKSQIIADHTVVEKFDDIPQYYISEAKKMLVWFAGESHSYAYRDGMDLLEMAYPTYACNQQWGFEAYNTSHVRLVAWPFEGTSESVWYTWKAYSSSEPTESEVIKDYIDAQAAASNPINVLAFAWCWDMVHENGPTTNADPVLGVHWYGSSVGGPDGTRPWGIDAVDNAETANSVSLQTYFAATEDYIIHCSSNSPSTKIVFTTGPVDSYIGEGGYQVYLKHEAIRDYIEANGKILFDYADILCHDDNGRQTTTTWNGHTYPVITNTNGSPVTTGHISDAGAIRLAKAMWWLLARIAGWDGNMPVEPVSQSITLSSGWNILSFAVEPENPSLLSILQPLISEGSLIKLQDEKGYAIQHLREPTGWVNPIGNMSVAEGYKISLSSETTLNLTGMPVLFPFDIQLEQGWNILGFPALVPENASIVFGPLISAGVLEKVQNEQGESIEYIDGEWIFGFSNLYPGEGYRIKLFSNASLTMAGGSKGDSSSEGVSGSKSVHFKPLYTGNGLDHMNIYLIRRGEEARGGKEEEITGRMRVGDEIGVFDGDICVGSAVVEDGGRYITVIASFDDPETTEKDGFTEGSTISLKSWNKESGEESELKEILPLTGYSLEFERQGTTVLNTIHEGEDMSFLGDAYPNPSRNRTTFSFRLAAEGFARLEIIDMTGSLVTVIVNETLTAGMHQVDWNNQLVSGEIIQPGIYIYKLTVNGQADIKKLVIR